MQVLRNHRIGELLETKELSVVQRQCSLVKSMNKYLKAQEETKAFR